MHDYLRHAKLTCLHNCIVGVYWFLISQESLNESAPSRCLFPQLECLPFHDFAPFLLSSILPPFWTLHAKEVLSPSLTVEHLTPQRSIVIVIVLSFVKCENISIGLKLGVRAN